MKRLIPIFIVLAPVIFDAHAVDSSLSCDAFKVQPNGSVTVVKLTLLATPYGKITLQPGMSFDTKIKLMGLDVYGLYHRVCPAKTAN